MRKECLIGRLAADPIIATEEPKMVKFSINAQNHWEKEPAWYDVLVFDELADTTMQYLKKGNKVYIEGSSADLSVYMNKSNELKTNRTIKARVLDFL